MGCFSSILPIGGQILGGLVGGPAGAAIGGALGGALGGGSNPSAPGTAGTVYKPTQQPWADQQVVGQMKQSLANNPIATVTPQLQTLLQSIFQNPYGTGAQTASSTAGTALQGVGQNEIANSQALQGAAGTALQTAFDPQSALYQRTLNQLQQQVRAGEAGRGITMSPYGAGLENQALSNFNIDWQNQQLARMLQGLQGAGNAFGQAGNIGQQGAGNIAQGGLMPWQTYNDLATGQADAAGSIGAVSNQANAVNNANISNLLAYLGLGQNSAAAQNNANIDNFSNQMAAAQNNQAGLGALLSQIPAVFNNFQNQGYSYTPGQDVNINWGA